MLDGVEHYVANRTTAPLPAPGWYPDPGGANRPANSLRPFVILAIAGAVTFIVMAVLMQLTFYAPTVGRSGSLWWFVVSVALFLIASASIVATIVGISGTLVRSVRRH